MDDEGDRQMRITYKGQHYIEKTDIEVYAFDTNLQVVPHDEPGEGHVPGLYQLLVMNQDNPEWPYTVTNACVKYKRKQQPGCPPPNPPFKRNQVALNSVELLCHTHPFNKWMFQIIGPNNEQIVVRILNNCGNVEVASFNDEPGRVETFINQALYDEDECYDDAGNEYDDDYDDLDEPDCIRQDAPSDMSPDDAYERSPYVEPNAVPGVPNASTTGMVPVDGAKSPYDDATTMTGAVTKDSSTMLIVMSIIAMLVFGGETAFAFMHGIMTFVAVFGVIFIIAVAALVASIVGKVSWAKNHTSKMSVAKALAGACIAAVAFEVIAIVAIVVMAFTHTLPSPLSWLYDVI